MRDIKFRGRTQAGEWVYGDYHKRAGNVHCILTMEPDDEGKVSYVANQVDADTIGQFTGLHDKNGKEIYEGDIVCANHFFVRYDGYTPKPIRKAYNIEIDQKGLVTSVLYSRNYAIEFSPNKGWIMRNGSDQHRMKSIKGEANIEVIGNIHNNPELL